MRASPKKYLSVIHAAERWDVTRYSVYEWIGLGEILPEEIRKVGARRSIRIDVEAVEARWNRPGRGRPATLMDEVAISTRAFSVDLREQLGLSADTIEKEVK